MKINNFHLKKFLAVIISMMSTLLYSQVDKSIYGDDNRRLVKSLNEKETLDLTYLNFSKAILAQIPSYRITKQDSISITIKTKSLKDGLNFCREESFLDEPIVSSCTAFLVSPNLIMTAGHCIKDKFDCKKNTWVIDYKNADESIFLNGEISFKSEQVYQCAELIAQVENSKLDYALVKLDRSINDRAYLKLRESGKTEMKEPLILLGHPLGMPLMITDQIYLRSNSEEYVFKTNADAFSGNSGSPLIGLNSGLVEGILIRGDDDYYLDNKTNCNRTYHCLNSECRGETALRSSYLPIAKIKN